MAKTAHVPRLFVLAGTNGAGKSSIGGATIRSRGGEYFNPDEAAARIRQAQPHLSATQANSAAWHEGKRLLQHAIAKGLDYNFETTLGGKSFAALLKQAAAGGFEVRIWYVGLASPEHHLARVKARVKKGGHDIPEADIRRRFDQSRLQLIELLPHLAELRVYDNSDEADPHQGKAPKPRLVLQWVQGAATGTRKAQASVLVPASAQALMATPEWAKPVVMAALKLQSDAQTVPEAEALKDASTASVRPKRNRPAK
ncbi:MAG: zeta toxin family protein [Aquabacterium sp.]|uniref:zeta toxin family protein n=1 Tax=Aquabacterium sp. TaxID=1872578 RepID=UPI0025C37235|nr:zeta toxin family protein [Aquabacterium sp.]MBI5925605.1 zeta toxin family protein [Aquabacterium sp.]